jgi:hypothetical protein|tara:strand:+ start:352 stop:549 length:198 start_codon:yes stop_codon:yes gene_type:complete
MIQKPLNVPHISKEMLDALDALFPERTPEINMDMKEIYFRIGQRSVIRYLHAEAKKQSENIMEKK